MVLCMGGGDKKITRSSEDGKKVYQNPTDENLRKQMEKVTKASKKAKRNFFKQQFEVEPDESQSQEQEEVDPTVFCSTCGAPQNPPFDNHQPTIDVIEENLAGRELVINLSLQDDKSLFAALLEEATPDANELEQDILSHKMVSDVAMVDGGLIIETFMKSVECEECDSTTVFEWVSTNEYEPVQPYHQTVQNKVELLKQMADDEVVNRFEGIVEDGEIDKDTVKHREMLKGQRDKFSDEISNESVDLESLYPQIAENSDDGSLSTGSVNTDTFEINQDNDSSIRYSLTGELKSNLNNDELEERLEKEGLDVYSPDNDDS